MQSHTAIEVLSVIGDEAFRIVGKILLILMKNCWFKSCQRQHYRCLPPTGKNGVIMGILNATHKKSIC